MKHLFGTVYGHRRWSREGKESVQISSISGFGDRDLESRDASSPDSRNVNLRKALYT
jgi:hypothetical protein